VVADAGLLFDPYSADTLATALGRVLGDAELRRGMTERGYRRAAQFNWQASARTALAAFEDVTR
jgi:glycosyltransferase involved in cell wall biosynthesis